MERHRVGLGCSPVTRQINIDQRRTEAGQDDVEVVVGGRTFMFAPRLPVEVALQANALSGDATTIAPEEQNRVFLTICEAMVGSDDASAFIRAIDLGELMWLMGEVYGADMGELLASAASSQSTGNGSRPT
jgi:hypothetical protein